MKKKLPLILFLLLLLACIGFGVYRHISGKTVFHDSYVNGNSTGNLYNAGLFCESNGTVFFANPSDSNKLYAMDTDGNNLKKLSDDIVTFINADDNYVYYVRNNTTGNSNFSFLHINTDSLCRIDRDGGDSLVLLDQEPSLYASLVGNYIYYISYTDAGAAALYKVKIDGSEKKLVNENPYYTCNASGQYLYYNGLETDHFLRRLDTATDSEGVLLDGNTWMPTVVDSTTAYYMDCDNNYRLARVDIASGEKMLLSEDRIDCYNITDSYIYFQRNDAEQPALCRMNTDGSGYQVIYEGNYTNINTAAGYVYFKDFASEITYRMPIDGGEVELYNPGKEK